MNKFAERLRELRIDKNLTQEQLAKDLGFSRPVITNWELKNREPELDVIIKIAKYFCVTTDYLLGMED